MFKYFRKQRLIWRISSRIETLRMIAADRTNLQSFNYFLQKTIASLQRRKQRVEAL